MDEGGGAGGGASESGEESNELVLASHLGFLKQGGNNCLGDGGKELSHQALSVVLGASIIAWSSQWWFDWAMTTEDSWASSGLHGSGVEVQGDIYQKDCNCLQTFFFFWRLKAPFSARGCFVVVEWEPYGRSNTVISHLRVIDIALQISASWSLFPSWSLEDFQNSVSVLCIIEASRLLCGISPRVFIWGHKEPRGYTTKERQSGSLGYLSIPYKLGSQAWIQLWPI